VRGREPFGARSNSSSSPTLQSSRYCIAARPISATSSAADSPGCRCGLLWHQRLVSLLSRTLFNFAHRPQGHYRRHESVPRMVSLLGTVSPRNLSEARAARHRARPLSFRRSACHRETAPRISGAHLSRQHGSQPAPGRRYSVPFFCEVRIGTPRQLSALAKSCSARSRGKRTQA
jgi:hypothetical protein